MYLDGIGECERRLKFVPEIRSRVAWGHHILKVSGIHVQNVGVAVFVMMRRKVIYFCITYFNVTRIPDRHELQEGGTFMI